MARAHLYLSSVLLLVSCGGAERSEGTTSERVEAREAPSSAGGPEDPRMSALVEAHAIRRAEHCAPPLRWSDAIAAQAQRWADHLAASGCSLEHSRSDYGENLAAGTAGMLSPEDVVDMWYREVDGYRFATGGFSMETGHFTQLVWVDSQEIGCGVASCDGLDVWVCNYDPPGNVETQYQDNVLASSCR